jgi:L-rhamnose mutarotase
MKTTRASSFERSATGIVWLAGGFIVQRIAFQLRIREGMAEAYDEAHRHVWPELLAELESVGVNNYSIFRRGQQLFLYMHVPDFDQAEAYLAVNEVNLRWQQKMAPLFEPVPDLQPGETRAMMQEVFFMPGRSSIEGELQVNEKKLNS